MTVLFKMLTSAPSEDFSSLSQGWDSDNGDTGQQPDSKPSDSGAQNGRPPGAKRRRSRYTEEERRNRRRTANRESARRMRQRRVDTLGKCNQDMSRLQEFNRTLDARNKELSGDCERLFVENSVLKTNLQTLLVRIQQNSELCDAQLVTDAAQLSAALFPPITMDPISTPVQNALKYPVPPVSSVIPESTVAQSTYTSFTSEARVLGPTVETSIHGSFSGVQHVTVHSAVPSTLSPPMATFSSSSEPASNMQALPDEPGAGPMKLARIPSISFVSPTSGPTRTSGTGNGDAVDRPHLQRMSSVQDVLQFQDQFFLDVGVADNFGTEVNMAMPCAHTATTISKAVCAEGFEDLVSTKLLDKQLGSTVEASQEHSFQTFEDVWNAIHSDDKAELDQQLDPVEPKRKTTLERCWDSFRRSLSKTASLLRFSSVDDYVGALLRHDTGTDVAT